MVRPATKASVKGDFTRGNLQLRARDGVYYITVSTLTGKSQEHPGDYTRTTARALTNLEASLRIDPATPARYFLAAAYVQQGQVAKAKKYC
jgi:hypothetical protein